MNTDATPPTPAPLAHEDVPLDDIVTHPELQLRVRPHDNDYIDQLVEAVKQGKQLAPIVVFRDTDAGALRLADGHARVEATRRAGKDTIRAEVRAGDHHAAYLYALGANATNGERRTNADLRNAVTSALSNQTMSSWSNVQIAAVCHCSDPFVGKVRRELEEAGGAPVGTRRLGKDGRLHPAKKTRRASGSNGSNLTPSKADATKIVPAETPTEFVPTTNVMSIETLLFAPDAQPGEVSGAGVEGAPVRDGHEGDDRREVGPVDDDEAHEAVSPDHAATVSVLRDLARHPERAPAEVVKAAQALTYAVTRVGFLAQHPLDGEPPTQSVLRAAWSVYVEAAEATSSA